MSKLDELISELCPDGVEYIAIGDVVKYEQPTKYIVNSIELYLLLGNHLY